MRLSCLIFFAATTDGKLIREEREREREKIGQEKKRKTAQSFPSLFFLSLSLSLSFSLSLFHSILYNSLESQLLPAVMLVISLYVAHNDSSDRVYVNVTKDEKSNCICEMQSRRFSLSLSLSLSQSASF